MVGQTIGKYRIVQRLGRGGMGTVYKAVDETLDREVAIKVLNPDLADTELMKRFRAEAIALAKLNHPNIATIYELSRQDDELLMVMEFVRGESLDKMSDRTGPMPFERAAYLCGQVLDALGHAHRVGIVHRDLKPANIMLTDSGVVKVMDFGIARMAGTEHLTTDGYMMGTPAYMAPEQVMGHEVDGRADLYSVGVVLYRLLTSHLPFKADTAIAMVQKQIKDPPTPLRQFRAELPVWCEQILNRALAKAPADRYQTAEEFRAAITLSVAMAPNPEVTTILAVPPIPSDLEITVAPDTVPLTAAHPGVLRPSDTVPEPSAGPAEAAAQAPAPAPLDRSTPAKAVPAQVTHRPPAKSAKTATTVRTGAIAALLLAILAIVAAIVLMRPETPSVQPASTTAAQPVPSTAPPEAPPAVTVSPNPPALSPGSARGANDAAAGEAVRRKESKPPPAAVAPIPKFTTLSFAPVRLLVFSGADPREREVRLQLGENAVTVSGGPSAEGESKSVPYKAIIAIFQSRSREPRWVGPNGVVNPVVRIDGGMFGFLKGDRDWLTIRTKTEFIPIRSEGAVVQRVAAALQERTGLSVIRADRRRNRD